MKYFIFFAMALSLTACDSSSDSSNPATGKQNSANRVDWARVPSDFHPQIQRVTFNSANAEMIDLDAFGFQDDVEVQYEDGLPANTGFLRVYKVWQKQVQWGTFSNDIKDKTLNIKNIGSYQCSIRVTNGTIAELEGGCYVRIEIVLPTNAQIEVYNLKQLVSRRLFAMSNEKFLADFDSATWAEGKMAVIDAYLQSYAEVKKNPVLQTSELKIVIKRFMNANDKFEALRKLHAYVTDRSNLAPMIEDSFSYFDREEARRIVGL